MPGRVATRADGDRWLRRLGQGEGIRFRIFCFPYAGGSASMFRSWPALLPPSVGLAAVQLPGRDDRFGERPCSEMSPLLEGIMDAMRPHLDLPYALFGYSFGAQVSFNLAHALLAAGLPGPGGLFVAASPGPSEQCPVPAWTESDAGLTSYLRDLGGTPSAVLDNPELLQLVLPALRADLTALATWPYRARPALPMPIHAFSGEQDESSAAPRLMASWRRETSGRFQHTILPGGHFFVNNALPALAAAISGDLAAHS